MGDPTLFHGVAVVIDDEIDTDPRIRVIQEQIEAAGCYVVGLSALPDQRQLENLGGASFFVIDWNLYGAQLRGEAEAAPIAVPRNLRRQQIREIIEFLRQLKTIRFAPVFIFTNEAVDEVKDHLKKHQDLYDESDPSHILVATKAGVIDKGVFEALDEWLSNAPAAFLLKKWERQYNKAKNDLFMDFSAKSVFWPLILKNNFESDGLKASVELGNLIARNLLSRMTPFEFEFNEVGPALDVVKETNKAAYQKMVAKVLEGERFLPRERLHQDSIAPGDIFKDGDNYYINIRPDCDCIPREGAALDAMELYLLKGALLTKKRVSESYNRSYGILSEQDNESVIFDLYDEKTITFKFKALTIEPWEHWKGKRVGRLLPPFLTRLQQRYAAYLQRPGLTRIPEEAIPSVAPVNSDSHPEAPVAETANSQGGRMVAAWRRASTRISLLLTVIERFLARMRKS